MPFDKQELAIRQYASNNQNDCTGQLVRIPPLKPSELAGGSRRDQIRTCIKHTVFDFRPATNDRAPPNECLVPHVFQDLATMTYSIPRVQRKPQLSFAHR